MASSVSIPSGTRCVATRALRKLSTPSRQKNVLPDFHEPLEFLYGVKAAQCLQSRDRLRDCRVVVAASGIDLISDFRSAAMDDECFRRSDCARFSDRARAGVGV